MLPQGPEELADRADACNSAAMLIQHRAPASSSWGLCAPCYLRARIGTIDHFVAEGALYWRLLLRVSPTVHGSPPVRVPTTWRSGAPPAACVDSLLPCRVVTRRESAPAGVRTSPLVKVGKYRPNIAFYQGNVVIPTTSVEVMGVCSNPSWPADLGKCGVKV